eukprot:985723-Pyramimonas_sp.AAC.1
MRVRDTFGHTHWDLRWSSLWGHETCVGCAEMGVRDACPVGLPMGPRDVQGMRRNSCAGRMRAHPLGPS